MIIKSTGLKFYETTPEQDWTYRDINKYSDNVLILGDHWGIIPFQIITDTLIGLVTECDLIEQTGDVVDLLDVDSYDIIRHITIENDGTQYWIIFDGIVEQEIDDGVYYLKLGDGIQTVYSEYFKIVGKCNYETSALEKDVRSLTYYTNERGYPGGNVVHDSTVAPQMYYFNKKTYCCWMQKGGVPYDVESMVYAIYHKECKFSESYGIREGTVGGRDPHAYPAIIVADDGYIIIAHERLTGVGFPNAHNGFMQIKRSDNPEDETSWVNAIAHNASHFQELGNEGAWRLTYPHFDKLPNGKIFLTCRHSSVAELDRVVIFCSDDNGRTWNALGGDIDGGCDICDLNLGPSGDECYVEFAKHGNDNTLHVIVSWKSVAGANPPYGLDIYYIKSTDNAVNWQSVDSAHSKDITTGGNNPITKVELDNGANHYLVRNVASPSDAQPRPAVVGDDGIPYILIGEGIRPGSNYNQFVFYWTGAAWSGIDTGINSSFACIPSAHIFLRPNTNEYNCYEILTITEIDSVIKWRIYRSVDLIIWQMIYEFDTVDLDQLCVPNAIISYTFNYVNADYESFQHTINRSGLYNDIFLYSEMDIPCCLTVIELEWWNENDFCDVIYQTGYRNRLFFDAIMSKPENVIFEDSQEDEEKNIFPIIQTQRKYFSFEVAGSEAMFDMLGTLRLHDYIYVTFKDGTKQRVFDVKVETTWQDENLCMFKLSFFIENCTTAGCEDNFVLQENIVLNGRFENWTGAYPNRDPDDWIISEAAPAEISEVAPNQSHTDAGADAGEACNIFSGGTLVYIQQAILTIGKFYLIKIEITTLILGSLSFRLGNTDSYKEILTIGINRYIGICSGSTDFQIKRTAACDITIDNVSVIQLD